MVQRPPQMILRSYTRQVMAREQSNKNQKETVFAHADETNLSSQSYL